MKPVPLGRRFSKCGHQAAAATRERGNAKSQPTQAQCLGSSGQGPDTLTRGNPCSTRALPVGFPTAAAPASVVTRTLRMRTAAPEVQGVTQSSGFPRMVRLPTGLSSPSSLKLLGGEESRAAEVTGPEMRSHGDHTGQPSTGPGTVSQGQVEEAGFARHPRPRKRQMACSHSEIS